MMWLLGVRWLHDLYGMVWDGMPMGIVRSWGPSCLGIFGFFFLVSFCIVSTVLIIVEYHYAAACRTRGAGGSVPHN